MIRCTARPGVACAFPASCGAARQCLHGQQLTAPAKPIAVPYPADAREELAERIDAWLYQQCGPTLAKGHMLIDALLDDWKAPAEHDARVAELLEANNTAVQLRRDAEARADRAEAIISACIRDEVQREDLMRRASPEGYWLVSMAAMKWLFGEGPDDTGRHFGDPPPDDLDNRPRFWWRTTFRRMTGWKS